MMLEIVAKCENGLFKKLSYFRLEIYKKYGARYTAKIKTVENSVESVEFHPKVGAGTGFLNIFHGLFNMWKRSRGFTKCIWTRMWKTFAEEKITEKMPTLCPDKIPVQKKPGIL